MILYHRTTAEAAESIKREGFRDATGRYMMTVEVTGVWLSNMPLDCNEGAQGDALLRIDLTLDESDIAEFEVVEEGKGYREWILPAALINGQSTMRLLSQDEEDEEEIVKAMRERKRAELVALGFKWD